MRSLWKGLFIKPLAKSTIKNSVKSWQRSTVVSSFFFKARGLTKIHNGLRFKKLRHRTTLIIGNRLGEFARTRRSFLHRRQKKVKKKKKK